MTDVEIKNELVSIVSSKVLEALKTYDGIPNYRKQVVFTNNSIVSESGIISIDKHLIVHCKSCNQLVSECSISVLENIMTDINDGSYIIDYANIEDIQQKFLSKYSVDMNCHSLDWYNKYKKFCGFDINEIVAPLLDNDIISSGIICYGWFDIYDRIIHSPIEIYPDHCTIYLTSIDNDKEVYKSFGKELNNSHPSIFRGSCYPNYGHSIAAPNRVIIYFTEEYTNKLKEMENACKLLFPLKVHYLTNTDK